MLDPTFVLARQPICRRDQRIFGYELLYRAHGREQLGGDAATADVAVHGLLSIGYPRLVGNAVAFVNIPETVLTRRLYEFLPAGQTVLELLETVEATREVLLEVRRARDLGYRIALDDFVPNERNEGLIPYADFIKVDVLVATDADVHRLLRDPARPKTAVLLAEKVESHDVMAHYSGLGFELFQGYFFARPQLVAGHRMPESRVLMVRLVAALQNPAVEIEDVERLVGNHVGLSFKLLRFVNSLAIAPLRRIESLRDAVMMLGLERIRTYATMLLLCSANDKPHELVMTALVRARYCELVAQKLGRSDPRKYFTAGLFSVLDAFVDVPMDRLVTELSVSDQLSEALLKREGPLGEVLGAAVACEVADWERMVSIGLLPEQQLDAYLGALNWATDSLGSLGL